MKPLLHPATEQSLRILANRPVGTYALYGPIGSGRLTALRWLMQSWHGHNETSDGCWRCRQIASEVYPDFVKIEPEKDSLGIADIQTLQHNMSLSRHDDIGYRIVSINASAGMTLEAQNALLKLAEEPPRQTILAIKVNSPEDLIVTLRSRVTPIHFLPLKSAEIQTYLIQKGIESQLAGAVTTLAGGRPGLAIRLAADPELLTKHTSAQSAAQGLCEGPLFDRLVLAATIADSKSADLPLLVTAISRYLRASMWQAVASGNANIPSAVLRIGALESLIRRLAANAPVKTALSGLVLDLA